MGIMIRTNLIISTLNTIILIIIISIATKFINENINKNTTKLFVLTTAIQANSCFHLMLPDVESEELFPEKFKKPTK